MSSTAGDVAALIGPVLGWDAGRIADEARTYADRVWAELARAGLEPTDGIGPDRSVATGGGTSGPR